MTTKATRDIVKSYIMDQFLYGEDPDMLGGDDPLITGGILDSIALIKLVGFLEKRFDIDFAAHEMTEDFLDTLDDITALIERKTHEVT